MQSVNAVYPNQISIISLILIFPLQREFYPASPYITSLISTTLRAMLDRFSPNRAPETGYSLWLLHSNVSPQKPHTQTIIFRGPLLYLKPQEVPRIAARKASKNPHRAILLTPSHEKSTSRPFCIKRNGRSDLRALDLRPIPADGAKFDNQTYPSIHTTQQDFYDYRIQFSYRNNIVRKTSAQNRLVLVAAFLLKRRRTMRHTVTLRYLVGRAILLGTMATRAEQQKQRCLQQLEFLRLAAQHFLNDRNWCRFCHWWCRRSSKLPRLCNPSERSAHSAGLNSIP
jgi:hypothetical protein